MPAIHRGSFTDQISQLEVGERLFIETTKERYLTVQRRATHPSVKRLLGDVKFSAKVWTAVTGVGETTVLVSITRTK